MSHLLMHSQGCLKSSCVFVKESLKKKNRLLVSH